MNLPQDPLARRYHQHDIQVGERRGEGRKGRVGREGREREERRGKRGEGRGRGRQRGSE